MREMMMTSRGWQLRPQGSDVISFGEEEEEEVAA
jgi:hypothetical protein